MTNWRDLGAELNAWSNAGLTATLWWRDDDAVEVTPQLERLIELAETHQIKVTLAVIPAKATPDLATRVANHPHIDIVQHGLSHANHEPDGQKKAELGSHRPSAAVLSDITIGAHQLKCLFPDTLPVLVPPWNRISDDVVRRLGAIGIKGLSTFQPRPQDKSSLTIVNTHADIIDWRGTRGFSGKSAVLAQLTRQLANRRARLVDRNEPTGLLTHHLVHDEECWQFMNDLFTLTREHPAVNWLSARECFRIEPAG